MSSTDAFKLLEAGVLLAAGVAFGWWQLRDVAKAREASRRTARDLSQPQQRQESAPAMGDAAAGTSPQDPGTGHERERERERDA